MSEEATTVETPAVETPAVETPAVETPVETPAENTSTQEIPSTPEESGSLDFLDDISNQVDEARNTLLEEPTPEPDTTPEPVSEDSQEDLQEDPLTTEEEEPYLDSFVSDFPDADSLSDTLDEKATAKWGELRKELAEARSRASDLEGNVGDNEIPALVPELEGQLQEAQERMEAYEQELSVSRVEQSAEYKRAVTEPLNSIMSAAEALAERTGADANDIFAVFSEVDVERQNNTLERITEEMGDRDKMSLYRMVDDAGAIFDRDAYLKERSAEASVELDRQNEYMEQEALQNYQIETRAAVNKVYDKFESVIPSLEGADFGELRAKSLDSDYVSLDADHQAYALSAGTVLPSLVKSMRTRDAKIASLEKQLSSYQNASPKAADAGGGVDSVSSGPPSDDLGFLEAISKITS